MFVKLYCDEEVNSLSPCLTIKQLKHYTCFDLNEMAICWTMLVSNAFQK